MSRQMSMFEPGDKLCTISGEDHVYVWVVNENAMVIEHDVRQRRIEEAMGIEPVASNRLDAAAVRMQMLRTAYDLLGDGQGDEWSENQEYTRAMLEIIRDMFALNDREAAENLLRQTNEVDAPDCAECGASNAGSREAPNLCDVCEGAS